MDDNNLKNVNENKAEENVVPGNYGECESNIVEYSGTIDASFLCKISDLPNSVVIQNFYVTGKNVGNKIYVTQRDGGNYYLNRYNITSNLQYLYANFQDRMRIENGGHGSTLDLDLNNNFVIGTCDNYVDGIHYSKDLGIVAYSTNGINNNSINRITGIECANHSGTNINNVTIKSVLAALTVNKKKILVYGRANQYAQFSIYDYDVFKAELSTSGKASFKNNGTLSKNCSFFATQKNSNVVAVNYFQGIALSNAVNNVHSIYIVSRNEGAGRELVITKLLANKNNETLTVSKSLKINLPYGNKSNNMILSTINYEIEGVHVIDESTLYVGISEAGVKGNKNNAYLLSISRSNF